MTENAVSIPDIGVDETEALLKYNVSPQDVEKYAKLFEQKVLNGDIDLETKFHYAVCLVHSKSSDIKMAIPLLKELFQEGNEQTKRDCLFYLSLAEARLRHYYTAKQYVTEFLSIEPNNQQATQLESYVSSHLIKDGVKGMAIMGLAAVVGGVTAIAVGGLVMTAGAGMAVVKAFKNRKKKRED